MLSPLPGKNITPAAGPGSAGRLASAALLFVLLTWSALGESVTLGWNPSPDAAGYYAYWGVASRTYTNRIDVGNATTVTIGGLLGPVLYRFAVTAYNSAGLESPYSNEVAYRVLQAPELREGEALVLAPVVFCESTNLLQWRPVATNYAWVAVPATNAAAFFRGMMLPLQIEREP